MKVPFDNVKKCFKPTSIPTAWLLLGVIVTGTSAVMEIYQPSNSFEIVAVFKFPFIWRELKNLTSPILGNFI